MSALANRDTPTKDANASGNEDVEEKQGLHDLEDDDDSPMKEDDADNGNEHVEEEQGMLVLTPR